MTSKKVRKLEKANLKKQGEYSMKMLAISEKQYKTIIKAGKLLSKKADVIQGGDPVSFSKKDQENMILATLSTFAVYGSCNKNPMHDMLSTMAKTFEGMAE